MYDAPENSGGKIKHEVYMVGRVTILIVVELNFDYNNPHDHFAYALLELEGECPFSYVHIVSIPRLTLLSGIPTQHRQRNRQPISCLRSFD